MSSTSGEELSPSLRERVLVGLGLSEPPELTLAGLKTLYAAWCRKVPFDNVRKLIHVHRQEPGPLPGDDATDFFEAWLTDGTGGTCWAGNGALYTLLVSLGFAAQRGIGTMLVTPDMPPNHATVLVICEGTTYVTDASILHSEPLPLDDHAMTCIDHPVWGVQCHTREAYWYIRWRPLHQPSGLDCRLDQLSATRQAFQSRHAQTRAWSPFNYELYARIIQGDTIVGVAFGQRVEFDAAGRVSQRHLEGDERLQVLVDELGMTEEIVHRLPPDTPTPPPPGSRTASSVS